jgi:toxin ParE1/3/4
VFIEFHPDAANELFEAKKWYDVQSKNLGNRFFKEIERSIAIIQQSPLRWNIYRDDIRWFHIHRFPFSIIYRVTDKLIQVLAVMHQRKRPFYWKKRIENKK